MILFVDEHTYTIIVHHISTHIPCTGAHWVIGCWLEGWDEWGGKFPGWSDSMAMHGPPLSANLFFNPWPSFSYLLSLVVACCCWLLALPNFNCKLIFALNLSCKSLSSAFFCQEISVCHAWHSFSLVHVQTYLSTEFYGAGLTYKLMLSVSKHHLDYTSHLQSELTCIWQAILSCRQVPIEYRSLILYLSQAQELQNQARKHDQSIPKSQRVQPWIITRQSATKRCEPQKTTKSKLKPHFALPNPWNLKQQAAKRPLKREGSPQRNGAQDSQELRFAGWRSKYNVTLHGPNMWLDKESRAMLTNWWFTKNQACTLKNIDAKSKQMKFWSIWKAVKEI